MLWTIFRVSMCLLAASDLLAAQEQGLLVRIVEPSGRGVPFAWVAIEGESKSVVADDRGEARFRIRAQDSLRVLVRRIGYRPAADVVRRSDAGYVVVLHPMARVTDTMRVTASADSPIERVGFYRRMMEVQRGAITGEFITPEELEERAPSQVSQILQGRRSVKVSSIRTGTRSRAVMLGRGGTCPMTILLDGIRMNGTVEQNLGNAVPQAINARGTRSPGLVSRETEGGGLSLSIDELVDVGAVAAIEIYPSTANAPAELIPLTGQGSCGIIAVWTGAKR